MPNERLPTARRQRQIAEAALRIIATQGVRRMTAAALAKEVGIADGTIFRHFKNKDEIVSAAVDIFETALEGTYPSAEGAPLDRLGRFLVNRLELVRGNSDMLKLAFNDRLAEAAGDKGGKRVERVVGRSVTFVHQCLEQAQRRGEITADAPLLLLVWMVIGVIRGAASAGAHRVAGKAQLSNSSPQEVWEALERFLRNTTKETDS